MVRAKYAALEPDRAPPKPKTWSESNPKKRRNQGWTKISNENYRQELKKLRENRKFHGPKNSGKQCDHCATDDHDRCWRVVCYCPCVKDKDWYSGWPNNKPSSTPSPST